MSYQLRGSFTTADPRLDRLPEFDERSRSFTIRALLSADQHKPRSYTWKVDRRWDQGDEGRCVEFSLCHELRARPKVVPGHEIEHILANRSIYWPAQQEDQWDGGSYPGADPFYEGTSVLAGTKVAHRLGFYDEYRWAFGLDDLILAVGYKGPAVLGINWYSGMFHPDENGLLHVEGWLAGGHAILVNSVDVKRKRFGLPQSWGYDWGVPDSYGIGGYCYLNFDDMRRLLSEDGEAMIPVRRH